MNIGKVGSEEGWTPSTFTSSKMRKEQGYAQKVEDFMDEEDGILGKV